MREPYEILSARFHRPCIAKATSFSNYFEIWVELPIELTKVDAALRLGMNTYGNPEKDFLIWQ
uniref:hypothetical protein n=1 Tax=Pseudomonas tremae TaxID=200454 RepID=UPI0019D6C3BC